MSFQGVEFYRRGRVQWHQAPLGPDDVCGYSEEVMQAMRLLEPLLQAGLLALHPDKWRGGRLCFMRPRQAMAEGWAVHVPRPG